jgi:hypothetical protein
MEEATGITLQNKRKNGLCVVRFCRNSAHHGSRYCCKHRRQRQKETNPVGYYFDVLRQNAKRRGIPFLLTKKEFALFCSQTGYIQLKGRHRYCASIDRIDAAKGYVAGNLQLLTVSVNASKGVRERCTRNATGWRPAEVEAF